MMADPDSRGPDSVLRIAKIPYDQSAPLIEEEIAIDSTRALGDAIPAYLQTASAVIDTIPLIRMTHPAADAKGSSLFESLAGLYAYSISSISESESTRPNVRATRLAMACGCHSQRFVGDVWIGRLGYLPKQKNGFVLTNLDFALADIEAGCCYSPDLRRNIANDVMRLVDGEASCDVSVPEWLGNAAQMNYHDGGSLAALAAVMTRAAKPIDENESEEDDSSSSECSSIASSIHQETGKTEAQPVHLTETTLCLHCRRPASHLCDGCDGAYFCDDARRCKQNGWSHQCLCSTWKIYVQRRSHLSSFPYLSGWQLPLLQDDCFTSESTYQTFLINEIGVIGTDTSRDASTYHNWWTTELGGWSGGGSRSAKDVNYFRRLSYLDGFALKNRAWIPAERHVTKDDIDHANAAYRADCGSNNSNAELIQNCERGLPILTSWEHYYRLRSLPPSSPIGLLATFPLSIYYAIQQYGTVPLVVAQMLERPLRIHIVGIEKELNFVDLFKEVGYLLPEDVSIDMTWVVREDMIPENGDKQDLTLQLTNNLRLSIVLGTYGDSLNPDFDCGGTPDMIIGMNAGLFAYESWRHVISYLRHHQNTVGVFTDYNEHSGMNCASLGGWKSNNSLKVNPFRQMRAMPVYCMNLPQFSNGFIYVFNEQDMDA